MNQNEVKYEVVTLKEKTIVGVAAKTGNNDSAMGEIIGGLWGQFYEGGVCAAIANRANEYAIGLYSDYEGDQYVVTVGAEVSAVADNQAENTVVKIIPAGKYVKMHVHGDMVEAVSKAWQEIWQMDLERTFTGDFEEYTGYDGVNADVDIYVAVK